MRLNVAIIILNWNGWRDTIECIESILRLKDSNYYIIVCDNASTDDSLTHICDWADGRLSPSSDSTHLKYLSQPPVPKPIEYSLLSSLEAETLPFATSPTKLSIIQTGANLGFAGGNNVGIKFALRYGADLIWLLNNDTVVDSLALKVICDAANNNASVDIFASKIYYYDSPSVIWYAGGELRLNNPSGARHLGMGEPDSDRFSYVRPIDFVSGCALAIRVNALNKIGLLDETLFAYYEDLDWCIRAKRLSIASLFIPGSKVFHKISRSTSRQGDKGISFRLYLMARNRFYLQRKNDKALSLLYLLIIYMFGQTAREAFQRLAVGSVHPILSVIKGIYHGLNKHVIHHA